MTTLSLNNALTQADHARGAVLRAHEELLRLLAGCNHEVIITRRGEQPVTGRVKLTHEFYTCGRYVFTAAKVHSVLVVDDTINLVIL